MSDTDILTARGLRLPAYAVTWRFSRAGGPGGQGVNTTDSRVELLADLTQLIGAATLCEIVRGKLGDELRIVAANERSQLRNRELAVERLITRLDNAARVPRTRRPTRVPRSVERERLDTKRRRGAVKQLRRDAGEEEA